MLDSASCELHVSSWRRPDLVGPNLGAPDIINLSGFGNCQQALTPSHKSLLPAYLPGW